MQHVIIMKESNMGYITVPSVLHDLRGESSSFQPERISGFLVSEWGLERRNMLGRVAMIGECGK